MAVGLRVRNANNILQIDATYKNLQLVSKGILVPPGFANEIHVIGEPPGYAQTVMAIKCTHSFALPLYDGTSYKLMIARDSDYSASLPASVEFFIFAETSNTQNSTGIGLKVRNPTNNQVIFNSQDRWLKILGRYNTPMAIEQVISMNFPGKRVAAIQSRRPVRVQQQLVVIQGVQFGSISSWSGSFKSGTESSMSVKFTPAGGGLGPPGPVYDYTDSRTDYLFIDVTGY